MTSQLPHAVFHLSVVSPEIMFVSFTNLSVVSLLEESQHFYPITLAQTKTTWECNTSIV